MGSQPEISPQPLPFPDRRLAGRRESDRILLQRDRELEAARRISQALFQHTEVDVLVEEALKASLEEVGAEAGSILLADSDSKQLLFQYSIGSSPVPRGTAIPWDKGVAGAVFQSGEPAIVGDVKQSGAHFAAIDQATGFVTRDMITLPLKRWKGDPIGVMNILNKRQGTLNRNDLALLTIISAFAALSIQQARLFQEAKMAEVVTLLGDIGHDLKNLLQPIVSGTWLLKSELDDIFHDLPESQLDKSKACQDLCNEAVGMIQKTTERIHERVKEIADCVKGLSSPPRFDACRLGAVVGDVIDTLRMLAGEKNIALRMEGFDTLPDIQADERRLYNAFYNLINNAIPEVPEGGSVTVRGQFQPGTTHIDLSVADTGRGMPPEIRDRLFSTKAVTTQRTGTGLGTKIVKDVVDCHHGRINVESEVGVGSTFHIRLPIDPTRVAFMQR
jgi:signal transduction histidine kinase